MIGGSGSAASSGKVSSIRENTGNKKHQKNRSNTSIENAFKENDSSRSQEKSKPKNKNSNNKSLNKSGSTFGRGQQQGSNKNMTSGSKKVMTGRRHHKTEMVDDSKNSFEHDDG